MVFVLLIVVVFSMIPQLEGLVPKAQYLVMLCFLSEGETLPEFHFRVLTIRRESDLLKYQTGQRINLTEKYIMEMSKLKHTQRYMTPFEMDHRRF